MIFNASVHLKYHSKAWKTAVMLVLQKLNKDNYTDLKAYCLIVLLNIMKKLLEFIITQKMSQLVKTYSLLLKSQMSICKECLTETVLQLLTEQIYIIWNLSDKPQVATMLYMNISETFNYITHERLIAALYNCRISQMFICWIQSFLTEHITMIRVLKDKLLYFDIKTDIL